MDFPHAPVQPPRLLQWRLEAKPWLIKKNKQTRPYLFVLLSSFGFVLSISGQLSGIPGSPGQSPS